MMKRFNITVNGHTYDVQVEETEGAASAPAAPVVSSAPVPTPAPSPEEPAAKADSKPEEGTETLNAPMPGNIINIMVKAGDKVVKGQALLILEAMKMENEIMSPRDAVVAGVHVNKGDSVDSGSLLVSLR